MISRNVWLYIVALALVWFNFQVSTLILNLYLRSQGYAESEIGWVNSTLAAGLSVMVLPSALILSRIHIRPLMQISIILFAVFSFSMWTVHPYWAILGLGTLSGTMLATIRVTAGPFFMSNSSRRERAAVFSFSSAADVLAGVFAFAVAGKLATLAETWIGDAVVAYRYTLYMGSIVGLTAIIPILRLKKPVILSGASGSDLSWRQLKNGCRLYSRVILLGMCVGLSAGVIIPFLNLFLSDKFGVHPGTIGWLFTFATAAGFVGAMMGPIFVRRAGLSDTLVAINILSIPFIIIMTHSNAIAVVSISIIIRSGIMGMSFPLTTNLCLEQCRPHQRGLVNAVTLFSINFSWMAAMVVGGYLIENLGYEFAFYVMIVLTIAAAISYYVFFKKPEQKNGN
ncbi:MAG: MFS transporter [Candidatus Zixiibacteriota bacterium]|nr:MAG: MFS transporter [candidate division Zixibacteria bacterium]